MPRNRLVILALVLVFIAGVGGYLVGTSGSSDPAEERKAKRRRKQEKEDAEAKEYVCNVCGETGKFRGFAGRKGSVCPTCKSKERHRLLMHWLANDSRLAREKLDVIHFSPEDAEENFLRKLTNLHYVTADYLHDEELRLDLTALDLPDASWDVLIVYHILEHIVEDQKAMKEMFRVLRPGGMVILQVPIDADRKDIYEDATITDDKGRAKAFGQKDHVRRYSASGLQKRLEDAGFVVEPIDYIAKLGPALVEKHKMAGAWKKKQDERIWVAHKPKADGTVEGLGVAKPGDAAAKPGEAAVVPSDAAAKPEDAAVVPGDAAKPEDGAVVPAEGTDGKATDAKAADGKAADGKAADGKAADGKAADGKAAAPTK
jgi:predicted SAM-dependent methyltransferase